MDFEQFGKREKCSAGLSGSAIHHSLSQRFCQCLQCDALLHLQFTVRSSRGKLLNNYQQSLHPCIKLQPLFSLPSSLSYTATSVVLNHQQGSKPWQSLSVSAAQFRRRQGNSWQLGGPRGPGPGHMADAVARLCHTQACFNDQLSSLGLD